MGYHPCVILRGETIPPALPLPLSTPSRNLVRLTFVRGITWTGFLAAIIIGIELLGFELRAGL